jgi:hypothetical protein
VALRISAAVQNVSKAALDVLAAQLHEPATMLACKKEGAAVSSSCA